MTIKKLENLQDDLERKHNPVVKAHRVGITYLEEGPHARFILSYKSHSMQLVVHPDEGWMTGRGKELEGPKEAIELFENSLPETEEDNFCKKLAQKLAEAVTS